MRMGGQFLSKQTDIVFQGKVNSKTKNSPCLILLALFSYLSKRSNKQGIKNQSECMNIKKSAYLDIKMLLFNANASQQILFSRKEYIKSFCDQ